MVPLPVLVWADARSGSPRRAPVFAAGGGFRSRRSAFGRCAHRVSRGVQHEPRSVDAGHSRPDDASDELVAAVGRLGEAVEYIERVRGHLYAFHQLIGHADLLLDEVVEGLQATGYDHLANLVQDDLLGANVLPGRWTFQIVEEFDDGYYATFKAIEKRVRDETMQGRRHVYEAEMKERRRTAGRPGHEATPGDAG
ncbi:MAG: hypothetical protein QOI36_4603 [Pseudonocardiales bacterium]|nr:hypothetical protein [Pseudonocardiales bacterium]